MNEHKAQAERISTDVKLTGSLRGLRGIENISLMFAMSATCEAGEARIRIVLLSSSGGNIPQCCV